MDDLDDVQIEYVAWATTADERPGPGRVILTTVTGVANRAGSVVRMATADLAENTCSTGAGGRAGVDREPVASSGARVSEQRDLITGDGPGGAVSGTDDLVEAPEPAGAS